MKHPTFRRFPRTMKEAFGPYTSNVITTTSSQDSDGLVIVGCVLAAVALATILHIWG